jgi:hypothetical protein
MDSVNLHVLSVMPSCDFCQGGELLFLDEQKDSQLEPKEGQLVFFSSGLEPLAFPKIYR